MPVVTCEKRSAFYKITIVTFNELPGYHKIRNVSGLRDLHCLGCTFRSCRAGLSDMETHPEDSDIDMSTSYHRK